MKGQGGWRWARTEANLVLLSSTCGDIFNWVFGVLNPTAHVRGRVVAGFPTVVQDSGTESPFYEKTSTSSSRQPSATGVTQACLEHSIHQG